MSIIRLHVHLQYRSKTVVPKVLYTLFEQILIEFNQKFTGNYWRRTSCRIGNETVHCSTNSSKTMTPNTRLSLWSAGSDTQESTFRSWSGQARAPTSTLSSICGRFWSGDWVEESSATKTSCSVHYKKNGDAFLWILSEALWSLCHVVWRLLSRRRDTRPNIRL